MRVKLEQLPQKDRYMMEPKAAVPLDEHSLANLKAIEKVQEEEEYKQYSARCPRNDRSNSMCCPIALTMHYLGFRKCKIAFA